MSTQKRSAGTPRGRVNWEKIRATGTEEIEREAERDIRDLGLSRSRPQGYRVRNFPVPNIKAIRERLGCSQHDFADRFGLSLRTIQQWEQGRAEPDQPAKVLLLAIQHGPDVITRVVSKAARTADAKARRIS